MLSDFVSIPWKSHLVLGDWWDLEIPLQLCPCRHIEEGLLKVSLGDIDMCDSNKEATIWSLYR